MRGVFIISNHGTTAWALGSDTGTDRQLQTATWIMDPQQVGPGQPRIRATGVLNGTGTVVLSLRSGGTKQSADGVADGTILATSSVLTAPTNPFQVEFGQLAIGASLVRLKVIYNLTAGAVSVSIDNFELMFY
jgi:hypothetical protein